MEQEDKMVTEAEELSSDLEKDSGVHKPEADTRDVKISKKAFFFFALAVLIVMLAYAFRGVFVAATVNGSPISRLALIQTLEKASGKQALESLVMQKVIASEVKKRGITVSPAELDAEVTKIREQVSGQGGTLEELLAQQGMTLDSLNEQIRTQLEVEKMIADKIAVTDAEVDEYIAKNKLDIPADQLEAARAQIADQLKRDKVNTEGQAFVSALRETAKVSVFVQY
ncbi:MAG: Foldase protein PrsA [Parcubacteria group bacterium GW2011_GWA2_47_7]|nr:MAG: Foldase protein PrsA [Parcubacteria group bacterium GW2011_GWA2_47_7]